MKLLVDMNLSPAWVPFLVQEGFEAVHWSQVGPSDAADVDIMTWAIRNGCVVLTSDLDFGAILAATRGSRPSVVQIRSDRLTPDDIGRVVLRALRQSTADLDGGALLSIDPARGRLRILPIAERS